MGNKKPIKRNLSRVRKEKKMLREFQQNSNLGLFFFIKKINVFPFLILVILVTVECQALRIN